MNTRSPPSASCLLPALALACAAATACGGDAPADGMAGGPLPEDPVAAHAALVPNCGTVVVGLTPLRAHELVAEPFALPAEASPVSVHGGRPEGAWRTSASASAFSARHPVLESTLVDPEGDPTLCRRAMGLLSELDVETLPGGVERRTRVYLSQAVAQLAAPPPAEALAAEGARIPGGALTHRLSRVVSEGSPAAGGAVIWRARETRDFPVRMTCAQGLELRSQLLGYPAADYAKALEAGEQSGTYCKPQGWDAYVCVGYAPQPTLDGCTLVVEAAALTTEDGRAFRASLAGTLARRGSAEDPYYELTLDKVRVE